MSDTPDDQIRAACDTAMRLDIPTRELVARIRAILAAKLSPDETQVANDTGLIYSVVRSVYRQQGNVL